MTTVIKKVLGREIIDSRGNPTVEAEVWLSSGVYGRAAVPSGASTGTREAWELRDGDRYRYQGKGVLTAVQHINQEINARLQGKAIERKSLHDEDLLLELAALDLEVRGSDCTPNKSRLGANAILAVSLALAKALAKQRGQFLPEYIAACSGTEQMRMPVPMMNIINGGAHADNNLAIQEFMILPIGAPTFREALRYGIEVFHTLKQLLQQQGLSTAVGDEGGFAPNLPSHEAALDLILQAIERAGYRVGQDIYLGLDVASSELYKNGHYYFEATQQDFTSEQFVDYLAELTRQYPILSIEDGLAENDWPGWQLLTKRLGANIQLVGDDIFVTNTAIFQEGIAKNIANAILIKPNQIGSLSETIAAIRLAKQNNYAAVISHRSGETEDTTIADISVGTGVGQIKTGSLCRTDRVAKYNQLLRIEEFLGNRVVYAGKSAFAQLA